MNREEIRVVLVVLAAFATVIIAVLAVVYVRGMFGPQITFNPYIPSAQVGTTSDSVGTSTDSVGTPPAEPPPELPPPTPPSPSAADIRALIAGGPYAVTVTQDIPYATVGGETLVLDIYQPSGVSTAVPVIAFTHGGGFEGGDANSAEELGKEIASHGFAFASINYQASSNAIMPAPVYDDFGAIRYLRANAAKYNLDATRFVTSGISSGSVLATMVGVMANEPTFYGTVGGNTGESNRVQGILAISGEWYSTDLGELDAEHTQNHEDELGCAPLTSPDCVAKIHLYFPEFHLDAGDPPTLVIQGEHDHQTPPDNAIHLVRDMKAAGIDATLLMNPISHGDKNAFTRLPDIYAFLARVFEK